MTMKATHNPKAKNKTSTPAVKKSPAAAKRAAVARETEVANAIIDYLIEVKAELDYVNDQPETTSYRDRVRAGGLNASSQTIDKIINDLRRVDFSDFKRARVTLADLEPQGEVLEPYGLINHTVKSIVNALK
jgi:hypothetical protein